MHRLSGDDPALGVFLNRLSDLLFTLARVLGQADAAKCCGPRPGTTPRLQHKAAHVGQQMAQVGHEAARLGAIDRPVVVA